MLREWRHKPCIESMENSSMLFLLAGESDPAIFGNTLTRTREINLLIGRHHHLPSIEHPVCHATAGNRVL